ncbi:MAG TPA: hypothetical protein V6C82_04505, partial [Chroococcales cyanobacterium]
MLAPVQDGVHPAGRPPGTNEAFDLAQARGRDLFFVSVAFLAAIEKGNVEGGKTGRIELGAEDLDRTKLLVLGSDALVDRSGSIIIGGIGPERRFEWASPKFSITVLQRRITPKSRSRESS